MADKNSRRGKVGGGASGAAGASGGGRNSQQAQKRQKPWGGAFRAATAPSLEKFSASVGFDWRLYAYDLRGSVAHARMLRAIGVLTKGELAEIEGGLARIEAEVAGGEFAWDEALEDVHMNIEARLVELIGETGKKLHTARSRNDQVATDLRLYLRAEIDALCGGVTALQRALAERAAAEAETIMPGFTHLQSAQPITFGHHLLAWNEMLQRDYARLRDCRGRVNLSPLGSAALAGSGFAIDREMCARELGFAGVCGNSLDAVADRDFAVEFVAAAALLMVHLSRMAEEVVLWCADGFGFVELGDAFTTGSSIMPQKKNPDVAELVRGKCARVSGNLAALLMLMKGQPLAYNRDNQEDKEALFDSVETSRACVDIFAGVVAAMGVRREAMRAAAERGYATATDLADYLVGKGVAFRDAHRVVGEVVNFAMERGARLADLALADLQGFHAAIGEDVYAVLSVEGSVRARGHIGGTAPGRVAAAAKGVLAELARREKDDGE